MEQSGAPHIYVPGNHDPLYTYEAKDYRQLTEYEKSINLHRRVMRLAPHLWLAGIGGSCYVRYEDNSIRDFGFPYKEEFTDDPEYANERRDLRSMFEVYQSNKNGRNEPRR